MQLVSSFTGRGFIFGVAPSPPRLQASRQVTCMAKKKGTRIIVTLECTEARGEGKTPSRYTTQKVRRGLWGGVGEYKPVRLNVPGQVLRG